MASTQTEEWRSDQDVQDVSCLLRGPILLYIPSTYTIITFPFLIPTPHNNFYRSALDNIVIHVRSVMSTSYRTGTILWAREWPKATIMLVKALRMPFVAKRSLIPSKAPLVKRKLKNAPGMECSFPRSLVWGDAPVGASKPF